MFYPQGLKSFALFSTGSANLATVLGPKARIYGISAHSVAAATVTAIAITASQTIAGNVANSIIASCVNTEASVHRSHFGTPLSNAAISLTVAGVYGSFTPGMPVSFYNNHAADTATEGNNSLLVTATITTALAFVLIWYSDD